MPTPQDWERVIYHECGHVVVTMLTGGAAAPIVLRCTSVHGVDTAGGTFHVPVAFDFTDPNFVAIIQNNILRAAGGLVAEDIRFGNHGTGVTGDMNQVDALSMISHNPAERDADFPTVRAMLNQHWHLVVRLATIGYRKHLRMNLPNGTFPNTQLFTAAAVDRIYSNPNLTPGELAQAEEAAFYLSITRGAGSLPVYDPANAAEDLIVAAGDLLSEL